MHHENKTFNKELIDLANNEFLNCKFIDCELRFDGSGTTKLRNIETHGCIWGFTGAASSTIDFMTGLYSMGGGAQKLIEQTLENIRHGIRPPPPKRH